MLLLIVVRRNLEKKVCYSIEGKDKRIKLKDILDNNFLNKWSPKEELLKL